MKSKGFWLLIILIVLGAAWLWPAPNPLDGVQTVVLAAPGGQPVALDAQVLDGLEIALGKHRIRIVSDRTQADAVIVIEPKSADVHFSLDKSGFQGAASIRCLVTKGDQQSVMYFNLSINENGVHGQLVGTKFWEVWK